MSAAKILYIEDDPTNRLLVRKLLGVEGYRVFEAGDGPAGIETAERERPDLILLDMGLPGMDGYEIAGRLKQSPELRGIPVIALTASAMAGDEEKTLAAGCDGYISKPIDLDTFPDRIRAALVREGVKG